MMINKYDPEKILPPKEKGWDHTQRVLVYYEGNEKLIPDFSIAYYHYNPPFRSEPKWIDHSGKAQGRTPKWWWDLPNIKEEKKSDCLHKTKVNLLDGTIQCALCSKIFKKK